METSKMAEPSCVANVSEESTADSLILCHSAHIEITLAALLELQQSVAMLKVSRRSLLRGTARRLDGGQHGRRVPHLTTGEDQKQPGRRVSLLASGEGQKYHQADVPQSQSQQHDDAWVKRLVLQRVTEEEAIRGGRILPPSLQVARVRKWTPAMWYAQGHHKQYHSFSQNLGPSWIVSDGWVLPQLGHNMLHSCLEPSANEAVFCPE